MHAMSIPIVSSLPTSRIIVYSKTIVDPPLLYCLRNEFDDRTTLKTYYNISNISKLCYMHCENSLSLSLSLSLSVQAQTNWFV